MGDFSSYTKIKGASLLTPHLGPIIQAGVSTELELVWILLAGEFITSSAIMGGKWPFLLFLRGLPHKILNILLRGREFRWEKL